MPSNKIKSKKINRNKPIFSNKLITLFFAGISVFFLAILLNGIYKQFIRNNVLGVTDSISTNSEIDSTQGFKKAIALKANGTGFNYLELGNTKDINPKSNFTVELNIKPILSMSKYLTMKVGDYSWVSYKFFNKPGSTEFSLNGRVDYPNPNDSKYKTSISFTFTNSTTGCPEYLSSITKEFTKAQLERWHHIAGVIQNDGNIDVFFDGKKGTRKTFNFPCTAPSSDSSMYLGADGYWAQNGNYGGIFFGGYMDELRLSSVARYQNNFISPIYPFKNSTKNISLFHFNGNVNDSSANTHNGVVNGNIYYITH